MFTSRKLKVVSFGFPLQVHLLEFEHRERLSIPHNGTKEVFKLCNRGSKGVVKTSEA